MGIKRVALDTNIAIEVLNNNISTINCLRQFDHIYMPSIVCGELIYGARNSSRIQYNLPRYEALISDCKILNVIQPVANSYAIIKRELKESGCIIPENDVWIAATCALFNIPLFTRDKHFRYVSAIELIN
ncbi:PIN domain-containing protein [Dyadobacter sp.]|uniref:PIN domain-containing protein n=1 Tax=Dyadobacter sp. TaxID=1914288 RepID=UPI003F72D3C6